MDKLENVEWVDPKTLELAPWNPKEHTDRGMDAIDESLRRYGWMDALKTWRNIVLDGNARLKVALKREMEEVPILRRDDLTEEEAKIYSMIAHRIPQMMIDNEQMIYDTSKAVPMEKISFLYSEDELEEKRNYLQSLLQSQAGSRQEFEDDVGRNQPPPVMILSLYIPLAVWDASGEIFDDWFKGQVEEHPEFKFTKRKRG